MSLLRGEGARAIGAGRLTLGRVWQWALLAVSLCLGVTANAQQAEPGSELQVYIMTMGQGDLVWERFGHNALGIRDASTGTDIVYNWGTFSFEQEGFLPRFLRGEMLYWMAPYDAVQTVMAYEQMNRSVTVQELNLTPAQRLEIKRFVEWNQRDENKFYRYDYYLDNCSTRREQRRRPALARGFAGEHQHPPVRGPGRALVEE